MFTSEPERVIHSIHGGSSKHLSERPTIHPWRWLKPSSSTLSHFFTPSLTNKPSLFLPHTHRHTENWHICSLPISPSGPQGVGRQGPSYGVSPATTASCVRFKRVDSSVCLLSRGLMDTLCCAGVVSQYVHDTMNHILCIKRKPLVSFDCHRKHALELICLVETESRPAMHVYIFLGIIRIILHTNIPCSAATARDVFCTHG